jgi:hypothetical protein
MEKDLKPNEAVNSRAQNTIDKTNAESSGNSFEDFVAAKEASKNMAQTFVGNADVIGSQDRGGNQPQDFGQFSQAQSQQVPPELQGAFSDLQEFETQKQSQQAPNTGGTLATQDITLGNAPASFDIAAQSDFKNIPYYDKFEGSAWDDFYNSTVNAGIIRTGQGLANLIPTVASAATDAEWAAGWIDTVNDWADRNEGYVSDIGNKSFFDTWDMRSLAAGLGQGVGSMLPMIAAGATGGGSAAAMAASAINIMPTIVEEGLANGLTHQQASALSLSVSAVIGLMEKIGLDSAVQAGVKGVGFMNKKIISEAFKSMSRQGVNSGNFKNTVKLSIGEIAKNYRAQLTKDLAEKGVKEGTKQYAKAQAKGVVKGVVKEVSFKAKDAAFAGLGGAFAEGGTEALQSIVETGSKQLYDNYFASQGATVGQGKFGANVMSEEAFRQALEEGFYGGLIGGTFASTSKGFRGIRTESVVSALDSANKKGNLDGAVQRMHKVIDGLRNDPKDKQDLKDIVDTQAKMVKQMPREISNPDARMQIFHLSHLARTLTDEIEVTDVKNALPAMEDVVASKKDELTRRLADTKRAINDIYATTKTVNEDGELTGGMPINLDELNEDGTKKYFITEITGAEVTGKSKTKVNPDIAKAEKVKTEGRVGRFADRILKGEQMTSPEDTQFYDNNKEDIDKYLKERRENVPALTEAERVEVDEDYKEAQTLAQDEDLNYINETAPKSHEETYGKEAADKLNGIIDSIAVDEDLYEDGFTIRKDINEGQRGTLIDKLVTARRAVLDLN